MKFNLNNKKFLIFVIIFFIFMILCGTINVLFFKGNVASPIFWYTINILFFIFIYYLYNKIIVFLYLTKKYEVQINKWRLNLFPIFALFIIFILLQSSINYISFLKDTIGLIPNVPTLNELIYKLYHIHQINYIWFGIEIYSTMFFSIMGYIIIKLIIVWGSYLLYLQKNENKDKFDLNIKYYANHTKFISGIGTILVAYFITILLIIDLFPIIHNILYNQINTVSLHFNNIKEIIFFKLIGTISLYLLIIFLFVIYPTNILKENFILKTRERYINYLVKKEKDFFKNEINCNNEIDYLTNLIKKIEKSISNYYRFNIPNIIKYSLPLFLEIFQQIPSFFSIIKKLFS